MRQLAKFAQKFQNQFLKIWNNIEPVNNDDEEDEDEEVEELAARKEANFFERFRVISGQS